MGSVNIIVGHWLRGNCEIVIGTWLLMVTCRRVWHRNIPMMALLNLKQTKCKCWHDLITIISFARIHVPNHMSKLE